MNPCARLPHYEIDDTRFLTYDEISGFRDRVLLMIDDRTSEIVAAGPPDVVAEYFFGHEGCTLYYFDSSGEVFRRVYPRGVPILPPLPSMTPK